MYGRIEMDSNMTCSKVMRLIGTFDKMQQNCDFQNWKPGDFRQVSMNKFSGLGTYVA